MFFPNTEGSLGKDLKKIVVLAEMSVKLLGPCPDWCGSIASHKLKGC